MSKGTENRPGIPRQTRFLAGVFAVAGVLHFVVPKPFVSIVPKRVPLKRPLVYLSGLLELACSVGLLTKRRWAGLLSAGLLLGVWPANIDMAVVATKQSKPKWYRAGLWARVPVQLPLIGIALSAWNDVRKTSVSD